MEGTAIRHANEGDGAASVARYQRVDAEGVAWGLTAPGEQEVRAQLGPWRS